MKTILTILVCLSGLQASFGQHNNFQWLEGKWKIKAENIYEIWETTQGGQTLSGRSFRIEGADTIITEIISLEYRNGAFHYIPDITGDQPPVDFTVTSVSSNGFVAENPQHDFPKIIRYEYSRTNGREIIQASIEGNGKVIPYRFEKIE